MLKKYIVVSSRAVHKSTALVVFWDFKFIASSFRDSMSTSLTYVPCFEGKGIKSRRVLPRTRLQLLICFTEPQKVQLKFYCRSETIASRLWCSSWIAASYQLHWERNHNICPCVFKNLKEQNEILLIKITRMSSCVNARGIPPAA